MILDSELIVKLNTHMFKNNDEFLDFILTTSQQLFRGKSLGSEDDKVIGKILADKIDTWRRL